VFKPHEFKNAISCQFTPLIMLTPEVFYDMSKLVQSFDKEIGWVAEVERIKGTFIVKKIFLPGQDVDYTTTEITAEGFSMMAEAILEDDPENGTDVLNRIRFWGHSHHNMACTPSGQDDAQMEMLSKDVDDYFIRCIANKKGEMIMTLYLFDIGVVIDDCKWQIYYPNYDHEKRKAHWEEQIKALVNDKRKANTTHYPSQHTTGRPVGSTTSPSTGTHSTPASSELERAWDNYLLECANAGVTK